MDLLRARAGPLHNLFVALRPDAAAATALAAAVAALRASGATAGRWVAQSRHHLTLQFLGSHAALDTTLVARVCAAAARVRAAPFELILDRFGSFDRHSGVVWLGPTQVPAALIALHAALVAALRQAALPLPPTQPFVPHVTVLRNAQAAFAAPCSPPVRWPVGQFMLIDSPLRPALPYRVLGCWSLADSDTGT